MTRFGHTTSLLFFFFFFFFFLQLVFSQLSLNQTTTMNQLYGLLPNSTAQFAPPSPWNVTKDPNPCSWKGVKCTSNNSSITNLSLPFFSISSPDFLVFLCQIDTLEAVDLSNNHLSSIPDGFMTGCGKITGLKLLNISRNKLSGPLPTFNGFAKLESLDLSHNSLVGSINLQLDGLVALKSLNLGFNQFDGSVPINFGKSMVLEELGLSANHFKGKLPESVANYSKLTSIDLSVNNIYGSIPDRFGELLNLQLLILSSNNLSGRIPIPITHLQTLQKLNISWNSLNGSIPSSISSLQALTNLDLRCNNLSGSIPASIANLNSLIELQLGNNKLSGTIPLMPLTLQIALSLSSNLFEGPIPGIISKLTGLEVLDLSNNKFSGQIPDFLVKMTGLTQLVLSNNLLSGVIPKFLPFVNVDVSGNNGLINTTNSNSPSLSPKKRTVAVGIVVAVAVASVLAFAATFMVFERFLKQFCSVKGHWITDNSIYKSKLDFTKAMEAVSKPVNMMLKNELCTYYRALMPCGMSYCIKKINWSCKAFQLLSPERFVQELTVLGKLSNSNIMIPLAYTLTSRSAYIVYENPQHGTLFDLLHTSCDNVLKWEERYSIAVGVARGLAFLHGCSTSTGPIILLHLSTKSILMESLSKPLIGDFDLGKVIKPSITMGTISAVAGSFGYIPPEYAYTMRVTPSGNVYSFGIVMLELLTGRPAISEGTNLAELALTRTQSIHHDKWEEILDYRLLSDASSGVRDQMLSLLRIALGCIAISPDKRPNAESLLDMLLNVATI
ncbi:unnamed protein product [Camellia sinensis]